MSAKLLVDAFLSAARKHRLLDSAGESQLRQSLGATSLATPLELDAWLAGNATLPTEPRARLRRLLPNAQMWDDYKPHRPLAHLATGGMGEIWLASDATGDEVVVIKTMRGEFATWSNAIDVDEDGTVWLDTGSGGTGGEASPGAAMQRRIERESRITRQLHHPNIVHCRDHGLTRSGNLFMVLDYHGSGDLFELIVAHGRLSEMVALSLIEQVAAALEASHRLSLVHRDIKAGNIFLTPDGGAKLADFGFARSTRINRTQLTLAGSIIGSPSCMPPEQIEGRTDLDIRADLYALGCVLFQTIVGTPPFTGTVQEVMRSHCAVTPPALTSLRSDVSAATSAIVQRCLQKNREARYATPAELRRDLQAALTALGVTLGTRVPLPVKPPSAAISRLPLAGMMPTVIMPAAIPDGAASVATAATSAPAPLHQLPPMQPMQTAAPAPAPAVALAPAPTPAAAPVVALTPTPPTAPAPPTALLGDWLVLADHDTTIALFARPRLTLGKLMDASVDICLRNYPAETYRADCMRISRQHVLIAVDQAGGFQIQDLSSANGTALDGESLVTNRAVTLAPGLDHVLDVAQIITLRARAVPSRSATNGCAALILSRTKNRPGLAYALVREDVSIGGPGADIPLPGCTQGVAAWLSWNGSHWAWRSTPSQAWTPVGAGTVVDGGTRRWVARAGDPNTGV